MSSELTLFNKFTQQFTDTDLTSMDSRIVQRIGRNFFLAEERLWDIKNSVGRDAYAVGTFLGEENQGFSPSPALIELISRLPNTDSRKVFINKKAEWLFLCGRNVLSESIAKNPNGLSEGLALVQNEQDENLGYGQFKKEDTLIIKHILDKGRYLRLDEKGRNKGKKR
jgi:ribosome biogenesis protein Nip4